MCLDTDRALIPRYRCVPGIYIVIAIAVAFTIAVFFFYVWHFSGGLSSNPDAWGQFGDYFGGVLNPIFGLGGFIALLFTLYHQREELEKTTKHFEAQTAIAQLQGFESTFFQLLGLYRQVVDDLKITAPFEMTGNPNSPGELVGRACLRGLHQELLERYLMRVQRGDLMTTLREGVQEVYGEFYEVYGHLVGHYFRTIYNIVKFIDRAEIDQEKKRTYSNLLRAQLSKYELGLLFYNCVSNFGSKELAPLVVKYNLLKHLEDSVLSGESDREELGLLSSPLEK